ncbi:MAG: hypothetical protein Q9220_005203 [cf. Caloplaca sp. 1 TL-2023]
MAASSIDAFAVIYADPEERLEQKARANLSISYDQYIQDDFRVLSTNTDGNDDVEGLLYVPDFPPDSPCIDETSPYIPQNATRRNDFPSVEPLFIALAPWTSPQCVLSYLFATHNNVKAFIFYLPNSTDGVPPPVNDPIWGLGDGGSWKSKNRFPVYAIPGPRGSSIMTQLGQYSGAMADAPNGSLLLQDYGNGVNARMYATIQLSNSTSLPSLWAFLLIVLGIVLFLIGVTSGIMHLYQRRKRNDLRRRIANNEVDLERLGIKRLTVPQEAINILPQSIYNPSEKDLLDRPKDHITALSDFPIKETPNTDDISTSTNPPPAAPLPSEPTPRSSLPPQPTTPSHLKANNKPNPTQPSYIQPTCPICLDDFIPRTTTVRSLPCHHIYHPECIDPFLLHNSSLCPVCKSKVLPKGYCPDTITNAMVRRERQQRRNRDRVRRIRGEEAAAQIPVASLVEPASMTRSRRGLMAVQGRMASFHRQFGRGGSASRGTQTAGATATVTDPITGQPTTTIGQTTTVTTTDPPAFELRDMNTTTIPSAPPPSSSPRQQPPSSSPPQPSSTPQTQNRSERARRRASMFMRDMPPTIEDQERETWARLPRWRKALKSVFPGF